MRLPGPLQQHSAKELNDAIATAALAGVQESEGGPAQVSWAISTVFADFDDDSGAVRISVTNAVQV